ncbi:MAG: hypothetical protein BM556_01775 [Bacteriovorax sp. MedPE-SWde]|nr:MAG: hypothetical protein BM556_01775 [Bacteriovorax sp. MedPE-SWde]
MKKRFILSIFLCLSSFANVSNAVNNFLYNCDSGNIEQVRLALTSSDLNINELDRPGFGGSTRNMTCLNHAAFNGHTEIAKMLLKIPHLDLNLPGGMWTRSPINHAFEQDNDEIVKLLLNDERLMIFSDSDGGNSILENVAGAAEIGLLNIILSREDLDINRAVLPSKRSTLMRIVALDDSKFTEVIRLMLAHPNMDINYLDEDGNTALSIARDYGIPSASIRLLKDAVGESNESSKRNFLTYCKNGDIDGVKRAFNFENFNINMSDSFGSTCLYFAAFKGNNSIIRELVKDQKLEVFKANAAGLNPLMMAARKGHLNTVKIIIKSDYSGGRHDINNQDSQGWTALMYAASNGFSEVVSELLDIKDINLAVRNARGETAADVAMKGGYPEIAKTLQR